MKLPVARRDLPAWANGVIEWVADNPMSVAGRIAAARLGRPDRGTSVPVTRFADRPTRVLIGPVNYSAQATEWARALERRSEAVSARSMAVHVPGGFGFAVDNEIPVATYHNDPEWQRRQFEAVRGEATHVLVEAQEPLFGRFLGRDVERQVTALLEAHVDVAFLCHGTDIRVPSEHLAQTEWSMYSDPTVYSARQEKLARRNRALLERLERPVFVSTPDLLAYVPTATWCPVVVDPARWRRDTDAGATASPRLRVVHAPSSSIVKGTAQILPTLSRLHDEGVIDLTLVQNTPTDMMPTIFGTADVVVDQFRIGSYGVAACEAMAAGCIVVGHVIEAVREHVEHASGQSLPIVEATPATLEQRLRSLADDRAAGAEIAGRGLQFVTSIHDGRFSAAVLDERWLHLTGTPTTPGTS